MDSNGTPNTNQNFQTPPTNGRGYKPFLIVGLVASILILLAAVLFFDQIMGALNQKGGKSEEVAKNAQQPQVFPSIDPKVTCARFRDLAHARQNIDKACILDLSGKNLASLPEDISKLTSLQTIILADNNFTEFPESLLRIPTLIEIDLSNNGITQIPDSISQLDKLSVINLKGNPVVSDAGEMEKLSGVKFVTTK